MDSGINALRQELSKVTIEDLLLKDRDPGGSIEWENRPGPDAYNGSGTSI